MSWRLQGEVVLVSKKDSDGWTAANKFTVVLEPSLNPTELTAIESKSTTHKTTLPRQIRLGTVWW
jgi:hypothetical protein